MHRGPRMPLVAETDPMKEVILEMTSKGLGIAGVVYASTYFHHRAKSIDAGLS